MDMTITLHRDELTRAIRDFLPMRLKIGNIATNDDPPWIHIDEVEDAEFIPGHGVRVRCAARIHFPMPLLPDDFTVQHAVLEMVPAIVVGPDGPVLAFRLDVPDIDLKYVPEFVDRAVLKRLNAALVEHASAIAWKFGKTLTRVISLPIRLQIVRAVALSGPSGSVEVTADGILLRLTCDVSFQHEPEQGDAPVFSCVESP
jgi:hypothetical protein